MLFFLMKFYFQVFSLNYALLMYAFCFHVIGGEVFSRVECKCFGTCEKMRLWIWRSIKGKKICIKKNVRKKIIKEKNWSMLRKMFNESPPVELFKFVFFFVGYEFNTTWYLIKSFFFEHVFLATEKFVYLLPM